MRAVEQVAAHHDHGILPGGLGPAAQQLESVDEAVPVDELEAPQLVDDQQPPTRGGSRRPSEVREVGVLASGDISRSTVGLN